MPNTLIKAGAFTAVLGGVTTGSYFIRGYYTTERISHRISNQGMTLLTSYDNDKEWAKRWKEYIDGKDPWKLLGFDKDKENRDKVPQSFKNKCLYDSSLAIEGNENILGQIEKYCTKSFSMAEILKKDGFALLGKGDNQEAWKVAFKNYYDQNKQNSNPFGIARWDTSRSDYEKKIPDEYKTKCGHFSKAEVKTNREDQYLKVKSYCSKKI